MEMQKQTVQNKWSMVNGNKVRTNGKWKYKRRQMVLTKWSTEMQKQTNSVHNKWSMKMQKKTNSAQSMVNRNAKANKK